MRGHFGDTFEWGSQYQVWAKVVSSKLAGSASRAQTANIWSAGILGGRDNADCTSRSELMGNAWLMSVLERTTDSGKTRR